MKNSQVIQATVSGEIIKILKKESKYGNTYFDVQFKLLNTGSFYRSCVYTSCRNFSNWDSLLKVGNMLSNLKLITIYGKLFVDADSFPVLIRKANPEIKQLKPIYRKKEVLQMELF